MPNRPSTPHRTMRIPNDEWDAIKRQAAVEGSTATDVVRKAVRAYLAKGAVILAVVALLAGCGTAKYDATPTVTVTPTPAAPAAVSGAPLSCLSAARIAPPAWAGVNLSKTVANSIGRQFNDLTDDCLAGRAAGGSAPTACLKAAQTMQEYNHRTRPIAELDRQYKGYWATCLNG